MKSVCSSPSTRSLVVPYGSHSSEECGYCKGQIPGSRTSCGMGAKRLTVSDYQYLIDRGWRRSGTYCYKPINENTCCPCYTIRCDATRFQLKRSHKRVLSNLSHFLRTGERPSGKHKPLVLRSDLDLNEQDKIDRINLHAMGDEPTYAIAPKVPIDQQETLHPTAGYNFDSFELSTPVVVVVVCDTVLPAGDTDSTCVTNTEFKGRGGKSKARRWHAKVERMEARAEKENVSFEQLMEEYKQRRQARLSKNAPKSLEDYFADEQRNGEAKHFLDIRLVRSCPPCEEFKATLTASHEVFGKYQMSIHGDEPTKCDMESFTRFLVQSPLDSGSPTAVIPSSSSSELNPSLGSYHQQYWLDGTKLICVGVIDLLPNCLSSVYLFYDPDFAFLHLGTYSALREIGFIRQLWSQFGVDSSNSQFKWYYMGYYIHSCPKMSYKAQYGPCDLACPETYNWISLENAVRFLAESISGKYACFSSPTSKDHNSIADVADSTIDEHLCCSSFVRPPGGVERRSNSAVFDDGYPPPVTLNIIKPYLTSYGLSMIRKWARLVGRRALTGHIQIVIS